LAHGNDTGKEKSPSKARAEWIHNCALTKSLDQASLKPGERPKAAR